LLQNRTVEINQKATGKIYERLILQTKNKETKAISNNYEINAYLVQLFYFVTGLWKRTSKKNKNT